MVSSHVQERRKDEKQRRKAEKARVNDTGKSHTLIASACFSLQLNALLCHPCTEV